MTFHKNCAFLEERSVNFTRSSELLQTVHCSGSPSLTISITKLKRTRINATSYISKGLLMGFFRFASYMDLIASYMAFASYMDLIWRFASYMDLIW